MMHGNAAAAIICPAVGVNMYAVSVAHTRKSNPHLKASAAGFSYSMLHLVSTAPALLHAAAEAPAAREDVHCRQLCSTTADRHDTH